MIPKTAIEKAIEGGWFPGDDARHNDDYGSFNWQGIALDPTFWQALGKVLGIHSPVCVHTYNWSTKKCDNSNPLGALNMAREFYDLILTRDDTQSFWDELLKP